MQYKGRDMFKLNGLSIQVYATIVLSTTCFLSGFSIGWAAYTISLLQSEDSPLKATKWKLTLPDLVRVSVSFFPIFFSVYLNEKAGRKLLKIIFGVCFVLSWILITMAAVETEIIVGQIMSAMVMGMDFITTYAYISEIPEDSCRGIFLSIPLLQATMGAFVSVLAAMYCSYHVINYMNITISLLYLFLVASLKETPAFLLQQGNHEGAVCSLKFYRGKRTVSKELLAELNRIKLDLFREENLHRDDAVEIPEIYLRPEGFLDPWQVFESSKAIRRAAYSVAFQVLMISFMGAFTIQSYVAHFFAEVFPEVSYDTCILALNSALMVGSGFGVVLIDLIPRRTLMLTCSIFCTSTLFLLACQFRWHFAGLWVVPSLTLAFCCVYQIGVSNVVAVQMAEMFPSNVKVIIIMVSLSILVCSHFTTFYTVKLIIDRVGIDVGFFFFALMGIMNTLWTKYFMKETKNVPVKEIMDMYAEGYLYKNDHRILPLQVNK